MASRAQAQGRSSHSRRAPQSPRRIAVLAGRYRLERKLGQGGMATVYLADDLRHQRKVAIKVLRPELAAIIGAERFLAGIRTTANFRHRPERGQRRRGFLYFRRWPDGADVPGVWRVPSRGRPPERRGSLPAGCRGFVAVATSGVRGACTSRDLRADVWIMEVPGVTR